MPTLIYFHDPMCSWCWGYRPAAQELFAHLPPEVTRRNVLGGLAPDSDEPMPKSQRQVVMGHWRRIEAMLGTRFNFDFWKKCAPRRSTYPACRAVIAAANQGREEEMTLAIQKAYYVEASNPSDTKTLKQLAKKLRLDAKRFEADLESKATDQALKEQIGYARRVGVDSFPTLALERDGRLKRITVDYLSYRTSLAEIEALLG
ncbi:MAG: DsbA family protein [Gammaproteobacteria bacterium]|nr:DsbA family protein [Gammaproteobacteria bacterium]